MSKLYKTVKKYYDMGIYSDEQVKVFVKKGKITIAEYKQITGNDYTDE